MRRLFTLLFSVVLFTIFFSLVYKHSVFAQTLVVNPTTGTTSDSFSLSNSSGFTPNSAYIIQLLDSSGKSFDAHPANANSDGSFDLIFGCSKTGDITIRAVQGLNVIGQPTTINVTASVSKIACGEVCPDNSSKDVCVPQAESCTKVNGIDSNWRCYCPPPPVAAPGSDNKPPEMDKIPQASLNWHFTDVVPPNIPIGAAVLSNVTNSALGLLVTLGVILAIIYLLYSGIMYITSGGDKEKVASAKTGITYAVIGLILIILSAVIINVVGSLLGLNFGI